MHTQELLPVSVVSLNSTLAATVINLTCFKTIVYNRYVVIVIKAERTLIKFDVRIPK